MAEVQSSETASRSRQATVRPINVVGPIISQIESVEQELDNEEIFSISGGESVTSDLDIEPHYTTRQLEEEVLAQKKLISKLEEDLANQIKVNSELKKLLVASVGSDLEYKVEKLARDKAQLSATVGNYSEKLYKDFEDLDRVSIQADMWRSKFMASRLQCEELSRVKLELNRKHNEGKKVLKDMLYERQTMWNELLTCKKVLQSVTKSNYSTSSNSTVTDLTRDVLQLSTSLVAGENMRGHASTHKDELNKADVNRGLTNSEILAEKITAEQTLSGQVIEIPHTESIPRYTSLFCMTRRSHMHNCQCKQCQTETSIV